MILKEISRIADKKERLDFVIANKAAILKEKKSSLKFTNPIDLDPLTVQSKAEGTTEKFEIVGNSIGFLDSHDDVSIRGSFDKTVQERGGSIPILINHDHSPSSIFAKNEGVYLTEKPIKELGYDAVGTTQVLAAKIDPIYDDKMRTLYENGEITQHSVGIQYVKLELAVNDESDNEGFANWNKYLPQVINSDKAEAQGYFFAVTEQKLREISAVLWGSNPYTPTSAKQLQEELEQLRDEVKTLKEPSNHSDIEPLKIDLVGIYKSLNE